MSTTVFMFCLVTWPVTLILAILWWRYRHHKLAILAHVASAIGLTDLMLASFIRRGVSDLMALIVALSLAMAVNAVIALLAGTTWPHCRKCSWKMIKSVIDEVDYLVCTNPDCGYTT